MGDSPGRRRVQRPLLAVAVAVAVAVTVLAWGPAPANAQGAWTAVVTPSAAGGTALDGVACNGPTCVAVGGPCAEGACAGFVTGEVLYSGDDGTTWNVATVPATVGDLTRVSCANPADCLAVGEVATGATSAAAVIYTTDFGAKWQLEVAPGRSLSGVACPAYSECFVDGTSKTGAALLLRSPTFGATWVREHVPAGVAALGSLTCSTTSDCTAFGASGVGRANLSVVTTNAGVTWRLGHLPAAFRSVTGEGCLTALRCMVSGAVGHGARRPRRHERQRRGDLGRADAHDGEPRDLGRVVHERDVVRRGRDLVIARPVAHRLCHHDARVALAVPAPGAHDVEPQRRGFVRVERRVRRGGTVVRQHLVAGHHRRTLRAGGLSRDPRARLVRRRARLGEWTSPRTS